MSNNTDTPQQPAATQSSCCGKNGFLFPDLTWAMLLLRAWMGLRLMAAGIVKFKAVAADGSMTFSMENYTKWIGHAYEPFMKYGGLPEPMARLYTGSLGYLLLATGIMVFFGITNRLALLAGTAVMLSLSFGLFTLDDSQEIGYVAFQYGLFVAAIALAKHNRLLVFNKF